MKNESKFFFALKSHDRGFEFTVTVTLSLTQRSLAMTMTWLASLRHPGLHIGHIRKISLREGKLLSFLLFLIHELRKYISRFRFNSLSTITCFDHHHHPFGSLPVVSAYR